MPDISQILINNNFSIESMPKSNDNIENINLFPNDLVKIVKFLKENEKFNMLFSVTAIDEKDNFVLLYHLYSTKNNNNIILKVLLNKNNPEIESVSSLYSAADWHEREVFDLFGIRFNNHPDLKRILLPDNWVGHPLRKDYKMNDARLVWNER